MPSAISKVVSTLCVKSCEAHRKLLASDPLPVTLNPPKLLASDRFGAAHTVKNTPWQQRTLDGRQDGRKDGSRESHRDGHRDSRRASGKLLELRTAIESHGRRDGRREGRRDPLETHCHKVPCQTQAHDPISGPPLLTLKSASGTPIESKVQFAKTSRNPSALL